MFDFTIDYESISYKRYVNYRFLLFLSELKVTKLPIHSHFLIEKYFVMRENYTPQFVKSLHLVVL